MLAWRDDLMGIPRLYTFSQKCVKLIRSQSQKRPRCIPAFLLGADRLAGLSGLIADCKDSG